MTIFSTQVSVSNSIKRLKEDDPVEYLDIFIQGGW